MSQVERANVCSDPYRAALEDPGSVVRQMLADMVEWFHATHGYYPDRLCLTDGMTALLEAHYRREQVPLPGGKLINRDELFGCQLRFHGNRCVLYRESADAAVRSTDGDEPITEEDERQYPYQDWQAIVRDGDTRLGYEDWVRHRKEEARHDAQMEVVAMAARRDAAVETRPETYRQIIVDVPKIDCDVMSKLPGGVDWIQVQLRPSNADTNYNGSLDVILPRDQAVTCWYGDSMQPSQSTDDPNTRIGKQIVTELPGDYS